MGKMTHYRGDFYHPFDYDAVGDGIHDDTAALQATFNAAKWGGVVLVPPNPFRTTDTVSVRGTYYRIAGVQPRGARIVADNFDGPILRIEALTTAEFVGIENLGIEGSNRDNENQVGIEFYIANGSTDTLSKAWVRRCWIRNLGGWGIKLRNEKYDPLTGANADGLFQTRFVENVVENGIDLTYGGDSIKLQDNVTYGKKVGLLYRAVRGAKLLSAFGNVFLNGDGAVNVFGGLLARLRDNHCELKGDGSGAAGSAVIYIGGGAVDTIVDGNNVDAGKRYGTGLDFGICLDDVDGAKVRDNYIMLGESGGVAVGEGSVIVGSGDLVNSWIDDSTFGRVAESVVSV